MKNDDLKLKFAYDHLKDNLNCFKKLFLVKKTIIDIKINLNIKPIKKEKLATTMQNLGLIEGVVSEDI